MELLNTVKTFISDVWVNYRLGTIFAFLSMILVFITYVRLVREFFRSNNRLRVWPKLLVHAVWRVLLTICVYYGPVWTLEQIWNILKICGFKILDFIDFISHADRWVVILVTTGTVVGIFVIVTLIAVWQFGSLRVRTWLVNRRQKRESLFQRAILRDRDRQQLQYIESQSQVQNEIVENDGYVDEGLENDDVEVL